MRPGVPARRRWPASQRSPRIANRAYDLPRRVAGGNAIVVQGVERPAEIVNYRTIGLTPTLLVSGLALGAVVALALTLIASVRQRRRDLALLKTIGFVRRQLAAAVAWQATVAAVVGIVVGNPARGHRRAGGSWDLFARSDLRGAIPDGVRRVDLPSCTGHSRARQTSSRPYPPGRRHARRRHSCCGRSEPGAVILLVRESAELPRWGDRRLHVPQRGVEFGGTVSPGGIGRG